MVDKEKINKLLDKIHLPNWLVLILAVSLILRIPSFFEPYSYGDEMIYLTLGRAIRAGLSLYKDIYDNKPPLLYLTAALAGNLFWFKALLAAANFVSIIFFWKITRVLFEGKIKTQQVSVAIFALLTTLPLLEGNIANAELFMLAPTTIAFYILLARDKTKLNLFAAGVLFSLAALFKIPAIFEIPVLFFVWLITNPKKIISSYIYIALGFAIPILISFVWFFLQGALGEYIKAAFMQNLGYVSTWRPADVQKPFLERNLPLLIRGGVVLVGIILVYLRRKYLSKEFIFATIWLLLTLFAATLSERPYPHYLIQAVGPISLFLAILICDKTAQQSLAVIPLCLAFFVPVYFKFWYYPTTSYYGRAIKLAAGMINKDQYLNSFDGNVLLDYQLSDYFSKHANRSDKLFVWGDNATLYAMTGLLAPIKYVADYHVFDFSSEDEVAAGILKNLPEYVVVLPGAPRFPELTRILASQYAIVAQPTPARVYRLVGLK